MYLPAVTSWHIQNYIDYFKFASLFFFLVFFMALFRRITFLRKTMEMALRFLFIVATGVNYTALYFLGNPSFGGFLGSEGLKALGQFPFHKRIIPFPTYFGGQGQPVVE